MSLGEVRQVSSRHGSFEDHGMANCGQFWIGEVGWGKARCEN